ncbi:glycosyltransferase family 4 protein [Glaciecola petra]|uniref:Glycosyltransferase family 4 protein n=1 Tax=Glaciecola petra TaxID=3075602 RepID=A0ABU2ZN36_9ALTE|nr:glycosyltransferase family 4 protein [Aestuariibacter sp. P117]MDT0593754.1 glycosyltransferase family 4 protein [Aestuariibacter sp. P117]
MSSNLTTNKSDQLKILHVFNQPRGGGGSLASTLATISVFKKAGHIVDSFTKSSKDLPQGLNGGLHAALKSLYNPKSITEFKQKLTSFNPDIVHANEFFPLISPFVLEICKERGIPVVFTCDDYHLTCPARTHFLNGKLCTKCIGGKEYHGILNKCKNSYHESAVNVAYNYKLRKSQLYKNTVDHFITCSEFTKEWLVEHANIEHNNISAIPHAIEIPDTSVKAEQGQYASFAGRFVKEKGINTLLAAADICKVPVKLARNVNHFVDIDLPKSADAIVTHGREDLAEFYRNARFLVFPSNWFETYGVVGAESMAHGVPVLAAKIGALNNLIIEDETGVFFEAGNSSDLADKMLALWNDPEKCTRLGQAGRQYAIENFSLDANYNKTLAVYHRVLR